MTAIDWKTHRKKQLIKRVSKEMRALAKDPTKSQLKYFYDKVSAEDVAKRWVICEAHNFADEPSNMQYLFIALSRWVHSGAKKGDEFTFSTGNIVYNNVPSPNPCAELVLEDSKLESNWASYWSQSAANDESNFNKLLSEKYQEYPEDIINAIPMTSEVSLSTTWKKKKPETISQLVGDVCYRMEVNLRGVTLNSLEIKKMISVLSKSIRPGVRIVLVDDKYAPGYTEVTSITPSALGSNTRRIKDE